MLGVDAAGAHGAERLHAVVVPDLDVLRERKAVNVQELVRFELEGVSIHLPAHKRVLTFDVSMEPLARTTTGKLKRPAIRQLAAELARRRSPAAQADAATDDADLAPHLRRLLATVRELVPGHAVRADSNFELDLGLDSMERVELLASLEAKFGVQVPEALAQTAFTVRDLASAFEQAGTGGGGGRDWGALLSQPHRSDALTAILRPRPLAEHVYFALARLVVRAVGRPRVSGLEHLPQGACIVSPNHQSFIDPFLVGPSLPFPLFRRIFSVGAAEYFQTPLMRWVAAQLNVVPVDPDAHLLPAMQTAAEGLRHGLVLLLFPEGERSSDGRVKVFKKGAAILATHLEVPIVPVAIRGAFEIWPRNRPLAWSRLLWRGARPEVRFGPPLRAEPGETYDQLTARLRDAVEQLWLAGHGGDAANR